MTTCNITNNHSTHCDGVMKFVVKLSKYPGIKRITPAQLEKCSFNTQVFDVKIIKNEEKSWFLLARKGTTIQHIIVVSSGLVTSTILQDIIDNILCESRSYSSHNELKDFVYSNVNKELKREKMLEWKIKHKEKHKETNNNEKLKKKEKMLNIRKKKLKGKVNKALISDFSKRDHDIVSGKTRTKNSLK